MDRFWAMIRWGASLGTSVLFGLVFFLSLTDLKTGSGVPLLVYSGLIAAGAGWIGNLILVWIAVSVQKGKVPFPKWIGTVLSWSGTALLILLPGAHHTVLPWLFAVTVGCAMLALNFRQNLIFVGLLGLSAIASDFWIRPRMDISVFLLILVIMIGAAGVIHFLYRELTAARNEMSQLRREVGYLTQTNVRLQNHAVQEREMILGGERERIAREFHDTLGHTLTGLVVKLQAIQSLVRLDPDRVIEEIDGSCALVREALREARLTVSALRDPVSQVIRGSMLWLTLCETFAKCTGITIQTDFEEEFDTVDDVTNAVVYRFIQEALTNAYRHGEATLIDVAVWWRRNELRVRVSDNGHGTNGLQEGFGITGIRERVSELKGQVGWKSEYGKGFDIAIIIPCSRGEASGQNTSVDCG